MHYWVFLSGRARSETYFTLKVKGSDAVMPVSNGNCCPASDSPRKKLSLFHTLLLIVVVESAAELMEHLPPLHLELFLVSICWAWSFTTLKIRTEKLSLILLYKKWDLGLPNISCVSTRDVVIHTPPGERGNSRVCPTFSSPSLICMTLHWIALMSISFHFLENR